MGTTDLGYGFADPDYAGIGRNLYPNHHLCWLDLNNPDQQSRIKIIQNL
jgi:hypothetical protein